MGRENFSLGEKLQWVAIKQKKIVMNYKKKDKKHPRN